MSDERESKVKCPGCDGCGENNAMSGAHMPYRKTCGDRTRTREGLLIDANGWSEQDWADLHHAVDGAIEKIRARHTGSNDDYPGHA